MKLIIAICFCAFIPILNIILEILSGIVDWDLMNDVFKAMFYGPLIALAIGWPVTKLVQAWRQHTQDDNGAP